VTFEVGNLGSNCLQLDIPLLVVVTAVIVLAGLSELVKDFFLGVQEFALTKESEALENSALHDAQHGPILAKAGG